MIWLLSTRKSSPVKFLCWVVWSVQTVPYQSSSLILEKTPLIPASLLQTSSGVYVYPSLVQMQDASLSTAWGDQPRAFLPSQHCCKIANIIPAGAEPRASCPAGEVWGSPSCPCLGQCLLLSPLSVASLTLLYVGHINPSCPQACSRNSAEPPPSVATTATGAGLCRARQPQPAPHPRGFEAISGQLARS